MKSFSNFLISEGLSVDDISGRTKTGRIINKRQKKGKPLSTQDVERLDSARLSEIERDARGKSGEKIRQSVVKSQGQDDLLDKINKNRQRPVKKGEKFYGKPTGVDVKTGKAKYVPPKEISGRTRYLDPKTNKASEKGIKNYITKARQMPTGSNIPVDSKTTDSIAKIAKTEYTDKINQEYGGRRARRAYSNAPSLADVQKQTNLKDRLKQKYGKGEYRKGFKKTQGVNQADVSKKIASDTKAYNQKRTSPTFKDFSKDAAKNAELNKQISARRSATTNQLDRLAKDFDLSGNDSNTGMGANTQNKPVTPKNSTGTKIGSKTVTPSKVTSVGVKDFGRATDTRFSVDPKPTVPPKPRGSGLKMGPGAKSYKQFMQSAAPGKTLTKNLSKTLRPSGTVSKSLKATKKLGTKVLGKAAAPLSGVIDTAYGYNQYRDAGHGKLGSFVRGAIKGTASTLGFAGGALAGGLAGGGVASAVTGAAGGIAGSALAGKAADWAIGAYDKVFNPKKNLDPKYKKKIKPPKTTTPTPKTTSPYGSGWTKVKGSEKKGQVVGTNLQVRQPT